MAYSEVDFEYSTLKRTFYECPDCKILSPRKECLKCHTELTDEHKKLAYKYRDQKLKWFQGRETKILS